MTEDVKLAEIVRGALEEPVPLAGERLSSLAALAASEVRRRRRVRFVRRGAGLMAAVLAVAVLLSAVFEAPGSVVGSDVEGVIALLCEMDGLDADGCAGGTTGEALLNWQDAPCQDLL